MSLNKVMLIGNAAKELDVKSMQNGSKIANLNVATSEYWSDKTSGEKKTKTEWHRIVIYGNELIDMLQKRIVKGSKLYVEGKLQTRKWQNKAGVDQFITEILIQGFHSKIEILDGNSVKDSSEPKNIEEEEIDEVPF